MDHSKAVVVRVDAGDVPVSFAYRQARLANQPYSHVRRPSPQGARWIQGTTLVARAAIVPKRFGEPCSTLRVELLHDPELTSTAFLIGDAVSPKRVFCKVQLPLTDVGYAFGDNAARDDLFGKQVITVLMVTFAVCERECHAWLENRSGIYSNAAVLFANAFMRVSDVWQHGDWSTTGIRGLRKLGRNVAKSYISAVWKLAAENLGKATGVDFD